MTHLLTRVIVLCLLLVVSTPARAQETQRLEVAAGVAISTLRELDSREMGISGRLGWRLNSTLGIETEIAFYPSDKPAVPVTASRTELTVGMTVGPQLGRLRPFARVRPGVLRLSEAPRPVACILIFPPPLSCTLASGASLVMLDLGGGVELNLSRAAFVRFDVGDRLVRYPGPAFAADRTVHDDDFVGHDLRVAIGAGWRF